MKLGIIRAAVVAACASLAGCTDVTSFAIVGADAAVSCTGLAGSFTSDGVSLTGVDDPGLRSDFPANDFTLYYEGTTFTSFFREDGFAPIRRTGTFGFVGNEIILGQDPLIRGLAVGEQRFVCDLDGDVLTLTADAVPFDFDRDGVFERAAFRTTMRRF